MKKNAVFILLAMLVFSYHWAFGQSAEADSMDVLHYDLTIDLGNKLENKLEGVADITFVLTKPCTRVSFDLVCDSLRPVWLNGTPTRGYRYLPEESRLEVMISNGQPGDTHRVRVHYFASHCVESYGFGGMHLESNIHYNLGVAFNLVPHVFGRSWFPCRDNFYDKATYRFTVTSKPGWRAMCSGAHLSDTLHADGSTTSVWQLDYPIPTYLASVSSANWRVIQRSYQGIYDTYPATLAFTTHDSALVASTFGILDSVVPAYERCFGPYRWDRIGYISTPQGSMEHANNIALVSVCMASTDTACYMTICHELGHAWFGNLITCASAEDMWINEGGASFCEEVATEAALGREAALNLYQDKLASVLRSTHITDGGWRSLSGMPQRYTYGSTTYDKGALVWHSLRGYMGDSLFYGCMARLFDRCAFGNIDAAALRDSLMLYSGMDLTGFFDFHVFHPGFVDYSVDCLEVEGTQATLTLRQLLRGTDHYATGNRVPVTFFSADLRQSEQLMLFDDSVATRTFALPFEAAFAVVDYGHRLSDACTSDTLSLAARGRFALSHAYCEVVVGSPSSVPVAWAYVGHHFVQPTGSSQEGIVRLSNRYWTVSGMVPADGNVKGLFLYNMGPNGSSGASFVDQGFYDSPATFDSLCLLYRPTPQHPWQMASAQPTSGSTSTTGYFGTRLLAGEYALAVVDTALLSTTAPSPLASTPALRLCPNPSRQGGFTVDLGTYDKKFNLALFDANGRKVLQKKALRSGATIRHRLPAGTYIVLIQNNFLSLQSQIIIQ